MYKSKGDKLGGNTRFSVRASACEIGQQGSGKEEMRDLLSAHPAGFVAEPGLYMIDGGIHNMSEIRAPNAEKAGYYLDKAISSRSVASQGRNFHFIFTLHLYQHSVLDSPLGLLPMFCLAAALDFI